MGTYHGMTLKSVTVSSSDLRAPLSRSFYVAAGVEEVFTLQCVLFETIIGDQLCH